jgi:hypothetical protein
MIGPKVWQKVPRSLSISTLLAVAACGAEPRETYVVRLDLQQVATDTATRDRTPGFSAIGL